MQAGPDGSAAGGRRGERDGIVTEAAAAGRPTSSWIVNRPFDLSLFILPIFVALGYGVLANGGGALAGAGNGAIYILLGLTHFGSTWSFYFDRENLAHFSENKWVFYYIPVCILGVAAALTVAGRTDWIAIITYWFSGFHVMKQSTGFVALYRSRLGIFDPLDRKIDNAAVLGTSTYCLFGRYADRTDFGYEAILRTPPGRATLAAAGVVLLVVLAVWAWRAAGRVRTHGARSLPITLASLASVVMFVPFLYVDDMKTALMTNLIGHYAQYLGLVWIINRRKYTADTLPRYRSGFLSAVSQNSAFLLLVLVGYALVIAACTAVTPVFIGLIWIHFFVDRYLFRFRDPFVRQSLLPYLKPQG